MSKILRSSYPEKLFGGPRVQSAVGYLGLFCQVFCAFNRRDHPLDGQESSQVSGVGGDDDQREKPPNATNDASRERSIGRKYSLVFVIV